VIALSVNDFVWERLSKNSSFNGLYDKYRVQYGEDFKPFFPVYDNFAGDITWGTEPYFLYDTMILRPVRNIPGERHEQIIYTLVGKIPQIFEVKDSIVNMFDYWDDTTYTGDGYRVNDITVWQSDRTRGRDKVRQTYSTTLMLDVHYIPC
jgi:hypothetical protein